ncbi:MAG: tRNA pseudouridine(55) synthase TruB [Deltaproteobacteria bacterium]|nr:tRNA pseudouridine(55) synthase TruB [Deltaproteobacteria bacterium]MBW2446776.1 tRNA pseudouridine(55) synthase TruB [Deltaproteobacteria bacterium]
MGRRRGQREDPGPIGFLVVDKPSGVTSHDMVDAARRWLGTRAVGHLGTLDPLATGVLPLAVRRATKLASFVDGSKTYWSRIRLGVETDTLDADGEEVSRYEGALPDETAVAEALSSFEGDIEQVPPMYSAVKQGGVPLYKLARRGEEVEREPRTIHIESIRLIRYAAPDLEVEVQCSPGTYVRVLAQDLGRALGCGGHLADLRRTQNGPFTIEMAATPEVLQEAAENGKIEERLVAPAEGVGLPQLPLDTEQLRRVIHGGEIRSGALVRDPVGGRYAAVDRAGDLIAILELGPAGMLHPLRVLRGAG